MTGECKRSSPRALSCSNLVGKPIQPSYVTTTMPYALAIYERPPILDSFAVSSNQGWRWTRLSICAAFAVNISLFTTLYDNLKMLPC